ncbi:hypothetical protein [Glaciibacter superstes]|uniref:hypothetical protein n=1 Tax=Glaciibacter superstes TaxID=501023 RepID=UPI0003B30616|nr:hypothetical protein [Glaciibacter superstes]
MSSGGARNTDGSLIAHYRNPRLPETANEPEVDRANDALRRREVDAEERRRKENEDLAREILTIVVDKLLVPFTQKVIVPWATVLWDTKLKPEGKRLAQRLLHPKMSQPEAQQVSSDTTGLAAEIADPLTISQRTTDHAEIRPVQERSEDTALAEVIQMDDYQNRRSA